MTDDAAHSRQKRAARLAGFLFLFLMATAVFGEFVVRSGLVVPGSPAETARNVLASEGLFRLGIVSELVSFAGIVMLAVTLYVLLAPVDRTFALLALAWRLCEAALLAVAAVAGPVVLLLLREPAASTALEPEYLHGLVALAFGAQSAIYDAGLVFYSLGSAVFAWLFFRSGYVPRIIAVVGVVGSLVVLACNLVIVLAPGVAGTLLPGAYAPVFLYEVALGLWLLVRGVDAQRIGARVPRQPALADARG